MSHYYLARYAGTGTRPLSAAPDPFRPVTDSPAWSAIDLRPDPAQSSGFCVLSLPVRNDITGNLYLGDDLNRLSNANRNTLSSRLGITVESSTLRDLLPEILVQHARTDGSRWRPLRPSAGRYEIWLESLITSFPVVAGGATFTESFNKADAATIGPDLTWVEVTGNWDVVSNTASIATSSTLANARASHDSSGTDTYTQVILTTATTGPLDNYPEGGPVCRFSASATTWYGFIRHAYHASNGGHSHSLRKVVAGSETTIAGPTALAVSLPETLKVSANGSTIKATRNGSEVHSTTDTSITGNTRGGIYGYTGDISASTVRVDSFEFGDLAAASLPLHPRRNNIPLMRSAAY